MMNPVVSMMAASFLLAAVAPAGTAEVRERTKYFTVTGTTLEELDRDLSRKGPLMTATGLRHPGATEVKFDGKVTYQPLEGACRVAGTGLNLRLVKTLPKWTAPRGASPTTAIVWKTLSDDIARHEADHARIAKAYVKKMESALRNLRPEADCAAMEARVNAVSARYLADHQRAQLEFDTVEGREMNRRLKRLLARNVREAVAE
ncbi:MAG: DUF922 domain-containing protein [Rhizobiaceae bacterium]|nr:DUF922 domain-containing protein [Rhizobiaceae bacterium]